jgi:hypothetical protein
MQFNTDSNSLSSDTDSKINGETKPQGGLVFGMKVTPPIFGATFPHNPSNTVSNTGSTTPGFGFVFGNSSPSSSDAANTQPFTFGNTKQVYGACMGMQPHPNTTFGNAFGVEKKKDNTNHINSIYDELAAIRHQIEILTKATDNIYKIVHNIK